MPAKTIVVGVDRDGPTERVEVTAEKVDRDRDDVVRCYHDGVEIATFYNAVYAVAKEHLGD